MLHGIQKVCDQVNLSSKCHDLIGKVACNPITELFAEGKCENYPEINLELLADFSITYYRRRQGEKCCEKELTEKEEILIAAEMMDNIKGIEMHCFRKRTQNNEYKKQIDKLKDREVNWELVLPVNFAVNLHPT